MTTDSDPARGGDIKALLEPSDKPRKQVFDVSIRVQIPLTVPAHAHAESMADIRTGLAVSIYELLCDSRDKDIIHIESAGPVTEPSPEELASR